MSGSMHHTLLVASYRSHLVCCNSQSRAALIRHLRATKDRAAALRATASNSTRVIESMQLHSLLNQKQRPQSDIAAI